MTISEKMKKENLIDSIIALERQAKNIIAACGDNRKIFGILPREALRDTQTAALRDLNSLAEILGEGMWINEKRDFFINLRREREK